MLEKVFGLPDQIEAAWARVRELRLPEGYCVRGSVAGGTGARGLDAGDGRDVDGGSQLDAGVVGGRDESALHERDAGAMHERNAGGSHVPDTGEIDGIVLAGMGGSAIGGDLAASLFAELLTVPIQVVRDDHLPGWVGPRSLVVGCSFSGTTEETLAAFHEAGRRGARRVAVTSGGTLAEVARAANVPVVPMPPDGPPRATVGTSMASVMGILVAIGAMPDPGARLAEATAGMRRLVAEVEVELRAWAIGGTGTTPSGAVLGAEVGRTGAPNPTPSRLAARLGGRIPVVYAPDGWVAVARRWKAQLHENAKSAAGAEALPELNHNVVVGYERPVGLGDHIHVVFLGGDDMARALAGRIAATTELLDEQGIPHTLILAPAGDAVAQALWLVQYGDLLSLALAFLYGVDPTPIDAIVRLKAALAAGRTG